MFERVHIIPEYYYEQREGTLANREKEIPGSKIRLSAGSATYF
jgi:hypothetical protein